MANTKTTKKNTKTKVVTRKTSKPKAVKFGRFSKIQLLTFVGVFAVIGGITLYLALAVTPWRALSNKYHCSLSTTYDDVPIPATIKPGDDGDCAKMAKFVLKTYGGQSTLIVDKQFGPGMTTGVKNLQTLFGLTPNGIIGPRTWAVIRTVYLLGINPPSAPTSPPPPPNAYIGAKPGFSGKLTAQDTNYFNQQWPKWNTVGWCIIGHESHTAGEYTTANGDGAFQIIKSTWGGFYGYSNASSAPPDVQWVKYFYLYAEGAGGHNWHGTYWANSIGHLISAQGADLGTHNTVAGAVPCPNT